MPDKSMQKPRYVTTFLSRYRACLGALPVAVALGLHCLPAFAQTPSTAPPLAAPAPSPGVTTSDGDAKITVNFVNADIQSVIKTIGQWTGRNFILDPRVTGTVNIVSDKPVSKDLLYQILLSTL